MNCPATPVVPAHSLWDCLGLFLGAEQIPRPEALLVTTSGSRRLVGAYYQMPPTPRYLKIN
jgi:hypothetical protein